MLEPADYAAASNGSASERAKWWTRKRNACVILGNVGTQHVVAVLEAMLANEN